MRAGCAVLLLACVGNIAYAQNSGQLNYGSYVATQLQQLQQRITSQTQYSLHDFGTSLGDGSDATAAVTALFNCTPSGAGTISGALSVRIPTGNYQITAQQYVAGCNLSLIGDQGAKFTLAAASTFSNISLFVWLNRQQFSIKGIEIDINSATVSAGLASIIGVGAGSSNFEISNNSIINGTTGMLLIDIGNSTKFLVSNNYVALAAPDINLNQCIHVFSTNGSNSNSGEIKDNSCINSGMNINGSNLNISDNDISGWAFGGGIVTESDATNCHDIIIKGNRLHNSATSNDVNATAPSGIENHCTRALVSGNLAWANADAGISAAGPHSIYIGNFLWGNGTRADGHGANGISSSYGSSTDNGSNSAFIGNVAYDGGGGTQLYGYVDGSSSLAGIVAVGNNFSGVTGPYSVVANTTIAFSSAQQSSNVPVYSRAYVYSAPLTGATVTITDSQDTAIIEPAGGLAALTVVLPTCSAGYDGKGAAFSSTQTITALTVLSTAGSIVGAPTTLVAGAGARFKCRGANTTWYLMP